MNLGKLPAPLVIAVVLLCCIVSFAVTRWLRPAPAPQSQIERLVSYTGWHSVKLGHSAYYLSEEEVTADRLLSLRRSESKLDQWSGILLIEFPSDAGPVVPEPGGAVVGSGAFLFGDPVMVGRALRTLR